MTEKDSSSVENSNQGQELYFEGHPEDICCWLEWNENTPNTVLVIVIMTVGLCQVLLTLEYKMMMLYRNTTVPGYDKH